jgi:hypothetical protein
MILRSPTENENGGICDRLSPLSNLSPSRGKALIHSSPRWGGYRRGEAHRKLNFLRSTRRPRRIHSIYTFKLRALRVLRGEISVSTLVAAMPRWDTSWPLCVVIGCGVWAERPIHQRPLHQRTMHQSAIYRLTNSLIVAKYLFNEL